MSLYDIAAFIQEARICGIKGLTAVKTIDELFDAILPHNDYLDCELLEMIVEQYLDDDDVTKVKTHIDKGKLFKCTLKNKLQQYTSMPNISDMHLIVTIKLQADWGRVTLESIEKLVQNLLQYQHKVRMLKVESGSISVMLLVPKEKMQHFIDSSIQKLQFIRLTGILRLQIGAIKIFEERENKKFTFESAFLESSQCGDNESVQFLLGLGVNVNYNNSEGQTALIFASCNGDHQIVEILLKNGADPNIHAIDGLTPLIIASINGHLQIVALLLKACADPNICNEEGWTALMLASFNGDLQLARLLLKKNADPNAHDNEGCTPLMYASQNGGLQSAELLLKENADPNAHDNEGWTSLMYASQSGCLHIAELLLKDNADSNAHGNEGWTPLLLASKNAHSKVVVMLLQYKANPHDEIREHLDSFTIATVILKLDLKAYQWDGIMLVSLVMFQSLHCCQIE